MASDFSVRGCGSPYACSELDASCRFSCVVVGAALGLPVGMPPKTLRMYQKQAFCFVYYEPSSDNNGGHDETARVLRFTSREPSSDNGGHDEKARMLRSLQVLWKACPATRAWTRILLLRTSATSRVEEPRRWPGGGSGWRMVLSSGLRGPLVRTGVRGASLFRGAIQFRSGGERLVSGGELQEDSFYKR